MGRAEQMPALAIASFELPVRAVDFVDLLRDAKPAEARMREGMVSERVTSLFHVAHQVWVRGDVFPLHKESGQRLMLIQNAQQLRRVVGMRAVVERQI